MPLWELRYGQQEKKNALEMVKWSTNYLYLNCKTCRTCDVIIMGKNSSEDCVARGWSIFCFRKGRADPEIKGYCG